ncbi:glycosyltransferase [bacterium]|nr:glycosyltransferase [bacterium]
MRVSILTPVLNANKSDFLDQCINSVLQQTYADIEHIFSDGGSNDGTVRKIKAYAEKHPNRIKLYQKKDKGVGDALKNALKHASGDIVGWLDADDFYEPDAIETAVRHLKHDRNNFIYGGCSIVDDHSNQIGEFIVSDFDHDVWLNVQHYIIFAAIFFRKEVVENCGFVNDLGNDLYFYMNVAKKYEMLRVNHHMANWRLHSHAISFSPSKREQKIRTQRAREDFFLVLRHGGSLFAPRAMTYLAVLEEKYAKYFTPWLPAKFKNLLRKLSYGVRFSVARVDPKVSKNKGYFMAMLKGVKNAFR